MYRKKKRNESFMGLPRWAILAICFSFLAPIVVPVVKRLLSLFGFGPTPQQVAIQQVRQIEASAQSYGVALDASTIQADAKVIAHELGTIYGWYDPRSWTENEQAAILPLVRYTPSSVPVLELAYSLETEGRNLRADFQRYLTANQYATISYLWA